ncbi:hypothetical protein BDV10DRAFT_184025 [Aspergillus recurvatus]
MANSMAKPSSNAHMDAVSHPLPPHTNPTTSGKIARYLQTIGTSSVFMPLFNQGASFAEKLYKWVWGQFQLCLDATPSKTTAYVKILRAEYYWGGAWYSAHGKECHYRARAAVNDDEYRNPDTGGSESSISYTATIGSRREPLSAGLHAIRFDYWHVRPSGVGEVSHHHAVYGFDTA